MGRKIDIDDLIDATGVAEIVGLTSPNAVAVYVKRGKLPPPVYDRGGNKSRLWVRQDIEKWLKSRQPSGRPRSNPQ